MAETFNKSNASESTPEDFQPLVFWTFMIEMRSKQFIPDYIQWILVILFAVIFILGVIGNTLSFVTMSFTPMKKHSYSVYLIFLSMSDMGCLSGSVMAWINRSALIADKPLPIHFTDSWSCKISEYYLHSCLTYSAWLIVALSLERTIVVSMPFASRWIASRRSAVIISLAVLVIVWGSNIYMVIWIDYTDSYGCYISKTVPLSVHYTVATALACYIPIIAVIILNSIIVVIVRVSKLSSKNKSTIKVTKLLLMVTTTFLIVNIPITAVTPLLGIWSPEITQPWHNTAVVIMMINYAINFYLFLYGAEFRKCVRELFPRFRKDKERSATVYTVSSQITD